MAAGREAVAPGTAVGLSACCWPESVPALFLLGRGEERGQKVGGLLRADVLRADVVGARDLLCVAQLGRGLGCRVESVRDGRADGAAEGVRRERPDARGPFEAADRPAQVVRLDHRAGARRQDELVGIAAGGGLQEARRQGVGQVDDLVDDAGLAPVHVLLTVPDPRDMPVDAQGMSLGTEVAHL